MPRNIIFAAPLTDVVVEGETRETVDVGPTLRLHMVTTGEGHWVGSVAQHALTAKALDTLRVRGQEYTLFSGQALDETLDLLKQEVPDGFVYTSKEAYATPNIRGRLLGKLNRLRDKRTGQAVGLMAKTTFSGASRLRGALDPEDNPEDFDEIEP